MSARLSRAWHTCAWQQHRGFCRLVHRQLSARDLGPVRKLVSPPCCRLMLEHGANTYSGLHSTLESPGKLPITFALENRDLGMARLLLQTELFSSRDAHLLMGATCIASVQVLEALFGSPGSFSTAEISDMLSLLARTGLCVGPHDDALSRTPLMLACQHGNAAAVQALTGQPVWLSYNAVSLICSTCAPEPAPPL